MEKFQDKYRIKSARLKGWDYSQDGYYFVTICTKNRKHFFGEVKDKEMFLSPIGKIADKYWREIPKHFSFVKLGNFVVMPNHIHGIVVIDNWDYENNSGENGRDEAMPRLYDGPHPQMSRISPNPKSLSSIIGSFKSIVTKTVNKKNIEIPFTWQPRFWDHVIETDKEHGNIQDYILANPANWEKDEENLKCE